MLFSCFRTKMSVLEGRAIIEWDLDYNGIGPHTVILCTWFPWTPWGSVAVFTATLRHEELRWSTPMPESLCFFNKFIQCLCFGRKWLFRPKVTVSVETPKQRFRGKIPITIDRNLYTFGIDRSLLWESQIKMSAKCVFYLTPFSLFLWIYFFTNDFKLREIQGRSKKNAGFLNFALCERGLLPSA